MNAQEFLLLVWLVYIQDSGSCGSHICFFRSMGIGSLAWYIPQTYSMLLLLYEPYFTIACGQCKGVLGGFLSLQCLRNTECRWELGWRMRNVWSVPKSLTQAGGLHAGGCVYRVPKQAIARHFVPHNSSYTGSWENIRHRDPNKKQVEKVQGDAKCRHLC